MGIGRRSGEQRNQATSSHELKNKRRSRRGKGINSREFAASQGPGSVSLATGKQRRRRGGSSPVDGRCVGKSRPVARRQRLCLREADCAWEGGVGSRATQKVGPGLARIRIPSLVSGPFKLGYTDTSQICIRRVSSAYPYDRIGYVSDTGYAPTLACPCF